MELIGLLLISTGVWAVILVILLFIWAIRSPSSEGGNKTKKMAKEDLQSIKNQINGDED